MAHQAPRPKYLKAELILDERKIRARIAEITTINEHGCLVVPQSNFMIRLRGYPKPVTVCPSRVVYALEHPEEAVSTRAEVVHMCQTTQLDSNRQVCITTDHLALDTIEGRLALQKVRRKELIK